MEQIEKHTPRYTKPQVATFQLLRPGSFLLWVIPLKSNALVECLNLFQKSQFKIYDCKEIELNWGKVSMNR